MTENRAYGMVPNHAQEKDVICSFLGGSVLYVLRKQKDQSYKLVGDCYLHGFMYGEGFHTGKNEVFVIS